MQRPRREGFESAPRTRSPSGPRTVDVIVLTGDSALLATLREAAGVGHQFFEASSIEAAVELLLRGRHGIFVIDVAVVGKELARLTEKLQSQFPEVVLLATGQRNEQNLVAALVAHGRIYRFLHKPVSPARAELFISAATRRYGEIHHAESRSTGAVRRLAQFPQRSLLIGAAAGIVALAIAWMLWPSPSEAPSVRSPAPSAATAADAATTLAIAQAETAYDAGNPLPPTAGNALDLYRSVLQASPDNVEAQAGVNRIIAAIEQEVVAAIASKDAAKATKAFMTLQRIEPGHPRLDALQAELVALSRAARASVRAARPTASAPPGPRTQPRLQRVEATAPATPNLDLAKAYLAANQLIEPVDASALSQLRRARASGEDPSAVQIAATDLATRLLNRAIASANAGDMAGAKRSYEIAVDLDREFETSLPDIEAVAARVRELESSAARSTAVNRRLAQAARLRASGQLLEPVGENAHAVLKSLLDEGVSSPEIRTEQQRLSFALLESTRTALAAGNVDRADVLATRAEEIQPGLAQTKALREQIGSARAERDDRTAIVQAASIPRRREVPAVYPREALLEAVEGWVDLEFTISAEGIPSEISVKASQPRRTFETAAVQALRQWRFEPIVRGGTPQSRRAILRMEFKLTKP